MLEVTLVKRNKKYNDDDPNLDVIFPETQGRSWIVPGIYEFIVPEGITKLCGVAIGASGSSYSKGAEGGNWGSGAGGGGLGWKNAITVTPGETLTIEVGAPGKNVNTGDVPATNVGGRSCLRRGATVLFAGNGGLGGQTGSGTGTGGDFIGDGGGKGGSGVGYNYYTTGGGGAGGYAGAGGNGGSSGPTGTAYATNGAGGAGGGGSGSSGVTGKGGRGGGTGLFGQGANGTIPTTANTSGGQGSYAIGSGSFGGGGSLSCEGKNSAVLGRGGAVRVLWAIEGQTRAFPATNVGPI